MKEIKTIQIMVEEDEWKQLSKLKGEQTWREWLLEKIE